MEVLNRVIALGRKDFLYLVLGLCYLILSRMLCELVQYLSMEADLVWKVLGAVNRG